jgi:hypothetical protein
MRRLFLVVAFSSSLAVVPAFAQDHMLPDKRKTPGVPLLSVPDQKTATCLTELMGDTVSVDDGISLTMICTPGYSKCIRNVPQATKKEVYDDYGDPDGNHNGFCDVNQGCEIDHLISIELGGSNDKKNLWPQPYSGLAFNAHVKDRLENFYHAQVCTGEIALGTAQQEISGDWVAAYKNRIGDTATAGGLNAQTAGRVSAQHLPGDAMMPHTRQSQTEQSVTGEGMMERRIVGDRGMMGHGMMGPMGGSRMGHRGMMHPLAMRMIFALMDADGDGKISLQEWQAAHERLFKAMDTDHDNTVTLEEIESFMHGSQKSTPPH